jgi:carotenoid cleavage dioxygenase-like enzyme
MVHGLWIEEGRARHANRWVRTKGMGAEERAGHSISGGLMTPAFTDMALLGTDPDPRGPANVLLGSQLVVVLFSNWENEFRRRRRRTVVMGVACWFCH